MFADVFSVLSKIVGKVGKEYTYGISMLKILNLARNTRNICYNITNEALRQIRCQSIALRAQPIHSNSLVGTVNAGSNGLCMLSSRFFHTTNANNDLMEFFDNPKNWEENEVKVGRAWKKEELRIKSNKELHQLWYVLLKERNMLLTMEHECNDKMELFPSPERLDKVKISMKNLEDVVRERNKAYHLLETGETGERPARLVANPLGINYTYRSCEHVLPPHVNVRWIKSRQIGYGGRAVRKFLLLYREKLYNSKRKAKNRSRNEFMMIMRRNPNCDVEMLKSKFPDVNFDKLQRDDKIRGHFVPKVDV